GLHLAGHIDGIAVERRDGIACPARYAELQGEETVAVGTHGDADIAGKRVERLLLDADAAAVEFKGGALAAIVVDGGGLRTDGIEIAADRGDEARNVHGAARAGMPRPAAVLAEACELVLVEIELAIAAEAGQHAVIEGQFHGLGIVAVKIEVEHALGPED